MKESSDSDLPPLITSKGISNPLRTTVTSPHLMERRCPYCESTSIVEKTSLCGSVPNYSPSIWMDSVLMRTSPAYAKSPTNSSTSSRTPVMTHRVQKEYIVEVNPSQPKEERGILTPVFTSNTSATHEVYQQQNDEVHQHNNDTIEMNVNITSTHKIHHQNDEIHQQNDEIQKQNYEIHQRNGEIHQPNDDTILLNVTQCDKIVTNQKDNLEINTPVVCEDHEEVMINKPSIEEPNNEPSEISFEATIGSLPSRKHAFPQKKPSHGRSRSMDLQAQKLDPKRTTYHRHLSGKWHKGDESEISFAASLMEYATLKKLLKSSEASLDSSFSGAATHSDSLVPVRNYTLSSSDSRSVTPTGIPYSMDDPLYIHNSLKLYLDMKVFEDTEEFKLLLRVRHLFFTHAHTTHMHTHTYTYIYVHTHTHTVCTHKHTYLIAVFSYCSVLPSHLGNFMNLPVCY